MLNLENPASRLLSDRNWVCLPLPEDVEWRELWVRLLPRPPFNNHFVFSFSLASSTSVSFSFAPSFGFALLFAVFPAFAIWVPSGASVEASVGRRGLRITAFDEEGAEDLAVADAGFAGEVDGVLGVILG